MNRRERPPTRVFVGDVKPYTVAESLSRLRGPSGGVVDLPHSVLWAPGGGRVDLDDPGGLRLAYRAVLSEGTAQDQESILNRDRLVAVWPDVMLPRRVRELWERRFPELVASSGSDSGTFGRASRVVAS